MSQIPADCLNEIFEYFEDNNNLHSCLLVNRLWCKVSVRILWRDVWNYNTLIACLPNESKEILYKNEIIISTSISNPPMFNYATFCKILLINQINYKIERLLKNNKHSSSKSLNYSVYIVVQEIYKLFMNQISSLRKLDFYFPLGINIQNIIFTSYPGARDCLKNLSELYCRSDIHSEFFYQLSQICQNIQSLTIDFDVVISNGLTDLISVQKNLKYLDMMQSYDINDLSDIIPSLTKLPNTLIKLILDGGAHCIPLSFITKFINLQELVLSFDHNHAFEDFKKLQYITFSQLQILKFQYAFPRYELLIKFLENNGKNLKELYLGDNVGDSNDSLNLAIAKYCSNLRKLSTGFKNDELETLKMVFNSCQYLESIKIWCGGIFLNEKEALEMIVNYSPKNICELKLNYIHDVQLELLPKELESFFINWSNRVLSQKSLLSLIIVKYDANSLDTNDENMKIIEKYISLNIIKEFKIESCQIPFIYDTINI